jgi:hypothetical protein
MVSSEICKTACKLAQSDIDLIADDGNDQRLASEVLRSYGIDRSVAEIWNLLVYHLKAALELGLRDHARRLFLASREFLELHPELQPSGATVVAHG